MHKLTIKLNFVFYVKLFSDTYLAVNFEPALFEYTIFPRPPSSNLPSVALAGGKKEDSAKQQIRLAEKEQKLFETQEYIQVRILHANLSVAR